MPYINFTTNKHHPLMGFSEGAPLHDGKMPTRYHDTSGVRVDGIDVHFIDDSIVDDLQRTLLARKPFVRRKDFECTDFAGLMVNHPSIKPGMVPFILQNVGATVDTSDDLNLVTNPVSLYESNQLGKKSWKHVIVPAHTTESPMFLHKLGIGPICLSGLVEAMNMYHCDSAHIAPLYEP